MHKELGPSDNEKEGQKNEEKSEKVIIRLKRKIDDAAIPSIYIQTSNKRICNGLFYKHVDTLMPDVDINKENEECINIFLKHEEYNHSNNNLSYAEKKRKFHSLKSYEKDFKEVINNLKKYKIVNENVQYVDFEGQEKEIYKIIDVNLLNDNSDNTNRNDPIHDKYIKTKDKKYNEEDLKNSQNYEYDLYILDDQKLDINYYMDYFYDIKNNNVDTSDVIVLEDAYGNHSSEYEQNSFISSISDADTIKEMSDYPDENSNNSIGFTDNTNNDIDEILSNNRYYNDDMNDDMNDHIENSIENSINDLSNNRSNNDYFDNEVYIDYSYNEGNEICGDDEMIGFDEEDIYYDNFKEEFASDRNGNDNKDSIFYNNNNKENYCNFENFPSRENGYNEKKKKKKKISSENIQKVNSLILEDNIKDELEKRLKNINKNLFNVTLSDRLKILEQMENEYYCK
ncbi:conserved Plasmodium protein, unknown function [Plasmodium yoelii]|uniref:ATPase 3, putative n=2 Tax=Plasmodium yoelii TaxID=5861 RepID=Q7RFH7_PLAYO|nr:conserved Plasmodium protein, unknown function [Plasmodium yoelii]EAA16628.1 ATPase 3, putative [Plasmodium yoelii yoelii]CDU20704.1 conserved Plasmodium protein, unknown function [Plasmodium yoelii]VTZ81667.1 conserved Plasmodium protein, unknown function [Plasmodium yoelii]|eukprot:XP_725063.1 conserved Plasmodium protein, unknown function [Plasmodium yoelii]